MTDKPSATPGEQFLRMNEPRECPACWGNGYTVADHDDRIPCGICAETGKVVPYLRSETRLARCTHDSDVACDRVDCIYPEIAAANLKRRTQSAEAGKTPRTDAVEMRFSLSAGGNSTGIPIDGRWVHADFARQLERELAEVKEELALTMGTLESRERNIEAMTSAPSSEGEMLDDGFGNMWMKCGRRDCSLEIVRPGKVQCENDTCGYKVFGPASSAAPAEGVTLSREEVKQVFLKLQKAYLKEVPGGKPGMDTAMIEIAEMIVGEKIKTMSAESATGEKS